MVVVDMGVFRLVMPVVARAPLNTTGWGVGRRLFSFVVVEYHIEGMTASIFTTNCSSIRRMECFM